MKKILTISSLLIISFFGKVNAQTANALNFDGTNDYVSCGNVLSGTYTKEAWVMISNASSANSFISGGGTDGRHMLWAPAIYGNRLSAGHNGTWNYVQDPTPMVVGVWYHVAVTYNPSTTTMKLYKNGVLVGSNSAVPAYVNGNAVRLGSYGTNGSLLSGSIDEVRIWNTVRTGTQISSNRFCQIPANSSGLQQYYRCNQGIAGGSNPTITTMTDIAGTAQNGTLVNFALSGSTSNWISPGGVPTSVSATMTATNNVSCNGAADGSATVTASGGGTYTYSWSPSGGTAATATGLAPGTYTCTVTNQCGLTATATTVITQPPMLTANSAGGGTICAGQSINLSGSANGGTAPYNFTWNPGSLSGSSVSVSPTSSTTYTTTVTDLNGCSTTFTTSVVVNPTPSISITSNPSNQQVCIGNQATLTASGAQSYNWTGGISNGVAFSPTVTATYSVTGTDVNGCTGTSQATITVNNCGNSVVPCGQTITNKSQSFAATNVPTATQYRFKFYNNSTLALVQSVTQTSRVFTFSAAPNLNYGNTYRWTVAVNSGSGFGPESSINCTVTLGIPTATLPCGVSYNRYNGYSAVVSVVGAVGYRYTFYDNTTSALVAQVTQASNYIYFNGISQLMAGTTYKWTCEVQYNDGTSNVFGPASNMNCTVSMAPPTTTVPCNGTYNKNTAYSAASPISGATGYRFRFYQGATMVASRAQTSNYITFSTVNGIVNDQAYTWTVEVQYNPGSGNVYGPASTPCNITFSSSARLQNPDNDETSFDFGVSLYPNPLGAGVSPTVNITGADQKEAIITVVDLSGRVVYTMATNVSSDNYSTDLTLFPELQSGMYIMQVQVGEKVRNQKFIAE